MDAIRATSASCARRWTRRTSGSGSISQELESLRQAIPEPAPCRRRPSTPTPARFRRDAGRLAPPPTAATTPPANPGIQPQRLLTARAPTTRPATTLWRSQGFQSYLKYFPKSAQAHEAQLYIGESLVAQEGHGSRRRLRSCDRELSGIGSVPRHTTSAAWRFDRLGERRASERVVRNGHQAVSGFHSRRYSPSNDSNR